MTHQIEKRATSFITYSTMTPFVRMVEGMLMTHMSQPAVDIINALLAAGWTPPPGVLPEEPPRPVVPGPLRLVESRPKTEP